MFKPESFHSVHFRLELLGKTSTIQNNSNIGNPWTVHPFPMSSTSENRLFRTRFFRFSALSFYNSVSNAIWYNVYGTQCTSILLYESNGTSQIHIIGKLSKSCIRLGHYRNSDVRISPNFAAKCTRVFTELEILMI